jgi:hypothetical protein
MVFMERAGNGPFNKSKLLEFLQNGSNTYYSNDEFYSPDKISN